jgi:hypothetical protein
MFRSGPKDGGFARKILPQRCLRFLRVLCRLRARTTTETKQQRMQNEHQSGQKDANRETKWIQKTSKMKPKGCHNEPRNLPKIPCAEHDRKRKENGGCMHVFVDLIWSKIN